LAGHPPDIAADATTPSGAFREPRDLARTATVLRCHAGGLYAPVGPPDLVGPGEAF
jgi:hypothetical protein